MNIGIFFKDVSGNRFIVRPDQILFVEEITPTTTQITTDRWLKVFNIAFNDVEIAIRNYYIDCREAELKPYQDLIVHLTSNLSRFENRISKMEENAR